MEQTGLVFRPFINSWVLAALGVALVAASIEGYRRTTRPVSRRFKLLLLALRLGAVGALMLCLLRPSLETTHRELARRPLLVLVDRSRSMREIRDTPEGKSRLQTVQDALARNSARLEALRAKYELITLGFARGLVGENQTDEASIGRSAYGMALQQAFEQIANSRADAVIMIGDGSHNFGPPDPMDVAMSLDEQGVPLYTVGVGQDQATSRLRDLKVTNVSAPKSAFLFTSFPVRADVSLRGCQGLEVKVRMQFPGAEPVEKSVRASHDEETVPLEFDVVPEKTGDYKVTVEALPVPNELLTDNNARGTFVKVISGGIRVGFFDTVRPESTFAGRALAGAEHLRVRRVLVLPGRPLPEPQTEPDRYDVIVLGDLDSSCIKPSRMLEIGRAVVEEGKGLVFLLSRRSGGPHGWAGTALEDLLPLSLHGSLAEVPGDREFRVEPQYATHPILALGTDAKRTLEAWAGMPSLAGAMAGAAPKRGALVLAADQDGNPLLVVQRVGNGRVACLLADTTFRWFFTERDTQEQHRRFWRQLIMWAAGREQKPPGRLRLELSKQELLVGEKLKATVHLVDDKEQPIRDAELTLTLTDPEGHTVPLRPVFSRQAGAYVAEHEPAKPGDYLVKAEARRAGQPLGRDAAHFHASRLDVELQEPVADLKLLRRMSAATRDAGGRYYPCSQLGDLLDELNRRGEPLVLTTRSRRDVWDWWALFALFAACLSAEWALRKWKGLV